MRAGGGRKWQPLLSSIIDDLWFLVWYGRLVPRNHCQLIIIHNLRAYYQPHQGDMDNDGLLSTTPGWTNINHCYP